MLALALGAQVAEAEALAGTGRGRARLDLLLGTIAFRARALGAPAASEAAGRLREAGGDDAEVCEALAALEVAVAGHLLREDLRLAAAYDGGRALAGEALGARGRGGLDPVAVPSSRGACERALELAAPVLPAGAAEAVLARRAVVFGDADGRSAIRSAAVRERLPLEAARWHAVLVGREPPSDLGPRPAPAPAPAPGRRRRVLPWVTAALAVVAAVLAVHAFVLQTFAVPSGSMSPTIRSGDRVAADVLPFARDSIHRGDIVVFRRPPNDPGADASYLVKRVIGLPGDELASTGATVLVDGRPLVEPWLPRLRGACRVTSLALTPQRVPPGEYFVLGDCRGDSTDSRVFGDVPAADIVGKVDLVYWRGGHPFLHWF